MIGQCLMRKEDLQRHFLEGDKKRRKLNEKNTEKNNKTNTWNNMRDFDKLLCSENKSLYLSLMSTQISP